MARRSPRVQWIERQHWPEPPGVVIRTAPLRPVGARLEQDGALVRCRYGEGAPLPPEDAFRRFLRLDRAPAVRVRDFVARYGPLGIGDNGLPGRQDLVPVDDPPFFGHYAEEVLWYHHYAGLAAATVRLAAHVREGKEPETEDLQSIAQHWHHVSTSIVLSGGQAGEDPVSARAWSHGLALRDALKARFGEPTSGVPLEPALGEPEEDVDVPSWLVQSRSRAPFYARIVIGVVSWWLTVGRVQPVLDWADERRDFGLGWERDLWAELGLHLLFAAQGARGGSHCSACGRFVRHKRAPKRDQQVWCRRPECRRLLSREAKARSRGKMVR